MSELYNIFEKDIKRKVPFLRDFESEMFRPATVAITLFRIQPFFLEMRIRIRNPAYTEIPAIILKVFH